MASPSSLADVDSYGELPDNGRFADAAEEEGVVLLSSCQLDLPHLRRMYLAYLIVVTTLHEEPLAIETAGKSSATISCSGLLAVCSWQHVLCLLYACLPALT